MDEIMEVFVREYQDKDIPSMIAIWNEIVEEGNAFPQTDKLAFDEAKRFFWSQTYTGVALDGNEVLGLYILHPNNLKFYSLML